MDNVKKLEKVKEEIIKNNLPLFDTAKNLVFGKGNPNAKIMFIGEAPGEKEDEQGIPCVGSAGKELDRLLSSIGLKIEDVYIANILKYRPPKNRNPSINEIETHTPYLIKQIEIIKPKIIATLGNYSTKFILASFDTKRMKNIIGITNLHGVVRSLNINGMEFFVIPLFHPAAVLYNPGLKSVLEDDFIKMKNFLDEHL